MGEREATSRHGSGDLLACDIVMAGGVTSGIIYPGAVATIARRYSFHCIGGTSVGAIAAAVTAAAEYGRRTGANTAAFDQISALSKSLGETARDGHSRLLHLFTPDGDTKALFAVLTPLISRGGVFRKIAGILTVALSDWRIALAATIAAVVGGSVVAGLAFEGHAILALLAAVAAAALVVVVLVLTFIFVLRQRWLPAWRTNGYGICTGSASPGLKAAEGQAEYQGLTPWMHGAIQAAAGRTTQEKPLTFGDLWGTADPAAPRSIDLSMIASDISRNRSVQLPFLETPSPLYVETDVLKRYFPEAVAKWMIARCGEYDERIEKRANVIRLPKPQHLPVVFGARLSLSFPVLLSAVPLMTPDFAERKSRDGAIPLRHVWFSDGGLTSNFPIHFFDSPIPSRPTFCLNLVDFDAESPKAQTADAEREEPDDWPGAVSDKDQTKPIAKPRAVERTAARRPDAVPSGDPQPGHDVWGFVSMATGNRLAPVPFTAFDTGPGTGLVSFLMTLINTARFWSDNQLLVAPGVRDRVVHVALRDDEGGLNLDMDKKIISDLDLRGRAAGLLISARFDPLCTTDPETGQSNRQVFAKHRWVRFRNFMAAFEDLSRRFAIARRESDAAARQRGELLLDAMIEGKAWERLGYPAPAGARPYFSKATDDLEQLALWMADAQRANSSSTFDHPRPSGTDHARLPAGAAPRPKMRIRLRPLVDNDPRAENADLPERS
jgi:predicted acylesterase/phospholipase RssA